jgi:hypothetical protein
MLFPITAFFSIKILSCVWGVKFRLNIAFSSDLQHVSAVFVGIMIVILAGATFST